MRAQFAKSLWGLVKPFTVIAATVTLAACTATTPQPSPTPPSAASPTAAAPSPTASVPSPAATATRAPTPAATITSTPGTPAPAPTAPRIEPPIELSGWRPANVFGQVGAELRGLDETANGYVAVGKTDGACDFRAMVWRSVDGSRWDEVPGPSEWQDVELAGAAHGPAGVVAVGTRRVCPEGEGNPAVTSGSIWQSDDPTTWVPVDVELADVSLQAVQTDGVVYIAAGAFDPTGGLSGMAIVSSSDGLTWDVPVLEEDADLMFSGLAHSAETGWVAIGADRYSDVAAAIVWQSADGETWTRHETPAGLEGARVFDLAAGLDTGIIAVGTSLDGASPTIHFSMDGMSWTPAPFGTPSFSNVESIGIGYVGWQNGLQEADYGVWTSIDGVAWGETDAPDDFYFADVVLVEDALFANCPSYIATPMCVAGVQVVE